METYRERGRDSVEEFLRQDNKLEDVIGHILRDAFKLSRLQIQHFKLAIVDDSIRE